MDAGAERTPSVADGVARIELGALSAAIEAVIDETSALVTALRAAGAERERHATRLALAVAALSTARGIAGRDPAR